jgi:hypothetical protein
MAMAAAMATAGSATMATTTGSGLPTRATMPKAAKPTVAV